MELLRILGILDHCVNVSLVNQEVNVRRLDQIKQMDKIVDCGVVQRVEEIDPLPESFIVLRGCLAGLLVVLEVKEECCKGLQSHTIELEVHIVIHACKGCEGSQGSLQYAHVDCIVLILLQSQVVGQP